MSLLNIYTTEQTKRPVEQYYYSEDEWDRYRPNAIENSNYKMSWPKATLQSTAKL